MIAAAIALGLYLAYLLVTFGLRAWLLYRGTGTTGFNGFTEQPGSAGWWGGVLFAVAVLTGLAAPILQLTGAMRPIAVLDSTPVFIAGIVVALVGAAITLVAQLDGVELLEVLDASALSKLNSWRLLKLIKIKSARSRLYRSRFLQVNTRWKALAEIYTMHSFAPLSNLKIFVKNC